MQRNPKSLWLGLAVMGGALVCLAGLLSSAAIEALLGRASGQLAWGPLLFRILLALHGLMLIAIGLFGARHRPARPGWPVVPSDGSLGVEKIDRKTWIILAVLTLCALGLRLWRLNSCLWFDELMTLLDFVRPPLGEIVSSFPSQNQHMFYSILAHFSIRLFGESAWALRLPSVLFGTASLWVLFLFGRRIVGNTEALLACALLTVSYHHIWFSQNARGYMGLMVFTTLATWLWLEAMDRDAWRWWLLYALALFAGMWIHLTMVFVPAAHALIFLFAQLHSGLLGRRGNSFSAETGFRWKPVSAWLLCGSLTLKVYALSLPEFLRSAAQEGVAMRTEWANPLWAAQAFLRGLQVGWLGGGVVLCGGVVALAGWLSLFRRDWQPTLLMVLPSVLGAATMLALGHPLWPRFFFFSMGFALLIVVRGTMGLPRVLLALPRGWRPPEAWLTRAGAVLTTLLVAVSLTTVPRNYALPKQDFTGAREYVERNRQPGDSVVAAGLAGVAYSRYFAPNWLVALSKQELDEVQRDRPSLWLVYTIPAQIRSVSMEFWREIQQGFEVVKVFPGTLGDGQIYVCRKRAGVIASGE